MATVEIDEAELLQYRGLAGVMHKLVSNPKTRSELQRLRKEVEPGLVIPELEVRDEVSAELKAVREDLSSVKKEREAEKAEREREKSFSDLRGKWERTQAAARSAGYTNEGLTALEKFMEDNGIMNHEIAIPAFERLNPKASPVSPTGNRFDFFKAVENDDSDMKLLFEGNDRQFLNKKIAQTLSDIRTGTR